MIDILGWMIASSLVVTVIGIHYEFMRLTSDMVFPWALKRFHDRRVITLLILTLLLSHITEIWVFAFAMRGLSHWPALGHLSGEFSGSLTDFVYFSAVSYTSIGFGDIVPHGIMRALAVSEGLTGLLMIAWSASFTYLKMERVWDMRRQAKKSQDRSS